MTVLNLNAAWKDSSSFELYKCSCGFLQLQCSKIESDREKILKIEWKLFFRSRDDRDRNDIGGRKNVVARNFTKKWQQQHYQPQQHQQYRQQL